jgi:serine O-acetyltransferase
VGVPCHDGEVRLREDLRADITANIERPPTKWDIVSQIIGSRGVQAALLYRVAHLAARRRIPLVAAILARVSQLVFTVDISPRAEIGPGLVLRHAQGVVIGSEARVGARCQIFHQVTLGKRFSGTVDRPDGMPDIGDDVQIGAGAKLLGPITVGQEAIIGANAVVTRDIPAGGFATGNNDIRLGGS